jgi:hypothetical protein
MRHLQATSQDAWMIAENLPKINAKNELASFAMPNGMTKGFFSSVRWYGGNFRGGAADIEACAAA